MAHGVVDSSVECNEPTERTAPLPLRGATKALPVAQMAAAKMGNSSFIAGREEENDENVMLRKFA